VLQAERLGAVYGVVLFPPLGRAVTARRHQPMHDRQEDRALDREVETAAGQLLLQDVLDAALAPQPLEHQPGAHAGRARGRADALGMCIEDDQLVCEAPETAQQRVDLARRLQRVQAAEPMQDALDEAPVDALVLHEHQIGPVAVGLRADEHVASFRDIRILHRIGAAQRLIASCQVNSVTLHLRTGPRCHSENVRNSKRQPNIVPAKCRRSA
jgi:hypothetical protein